MPYYIHRPDVTLGADIAAYDGLDHYPTRAEAVAHIAALSQPKSEPLKITFIASYDERSSWYDRESARFRDGTYFHLPWEGTYDMLQTDDTARHYAHLAIKMPGLIAYTLNEEHGVQDRQTQIKPGRYLKQFFPHLSDTRIRDYASQCQGSSLELHITTDADEIEEVYCGGPSSCMSYRIGNSNDNNHLDPDLSEHPTRAYGGLGSSLALAYYGTRDSASGRAIVWPERMIYSRLYGGTDTLRILLESAGYTSGSLIGATIRAIRQGDRHIVPYVDGINYGKPQKTGENIACITLSNGSGSGCINLQRTDGYSADLENEEEEEDDTFYCGSCESTCNNDDYHGYNRRGDSECDSCWDNNSTECYNCSERVRNSETGDSGDYLDDDWYCDSCAQHITGCAIEDCENRWIERDLTATEQTKRENEGQTDICPDCAEQGIYCATCETFADRDTLDEVVSPYQAVCPTCKVKQLRSGGQIELPYAGIQHGVVC